MALLGALSGYIFLVCSCISGWVDTGTFQGWNPLVNDFSGVVRAISAALFFYPAVGFVVNLFTGALTYVITSLMGLSEERQRRVGVAVVGVVCFAVLSLCVLSTWLFARPVFTVDDVFKLILGAVFIWAALKWNAKTELIARFAGWALAGAAVLWLAFTFIFTDLFTAGKPENSQPGKPNVVLFLADAYRADVSALYNGEVPTPNLERLAAHGVTFTNCFSPSSWTEPSVVALFAGLAPEVSGMDSFSAIPGNIPYLPEQLSRAGYRTWCMMANPILKPALGFSRGFDFYGIYDGYFYGQGFLPTSKNSLYNSIALVINMLLRELDYERLGNLGIDASLEMLRSLNPDGGDFVYIHLYDPHAPYRPPKRFLPQDDYAGPYAESSGDFLEHPDELTDADVARLKQLYEAEVRLVDETLGRALDVLDDRGNRENTVFIFLADHGDEFREHGLVEHFHVNLQHELTHVPLVINWPGNFTGGGKFTQPVSLADVYATILDGLGIEYDEKLIDGRSLLRPLPEARPVFAQRCMDEGEDKRTRSDFVVRDKTALFVNYDDDVEELYVDYYSNPENVADDNPDLVAEMKALLAGWHERNAELMEHYGTGGDAGAVDAEHLEQLRAVGYIQ